MIRKLDKEINEIANILSLNKYKDSDMSLFSGATGTSLILAYYGRYSNNDKFISNGIEVLQQVINSLENTSVVPYLCNGIAGLGWAIEHLREEDLLDIESEDLLLEIDNILLPSIDFFIKDFPIYDYLYGLQGICYYFIMRKKGIKFIEATLNTLENNAIREKDGSIKWIYHPLSKEHLRKPCFNLGLAHGIPSTIHFLSTLVKENIFALRAKKLLNASIKFLMKQRLDTELFFSTFPSSIPIKSKNNNPSNSRLAWCYGDVGIGYVLFTTSLIINDQSLRSEAIKILLKTTKRRKQMESKIVDIGFCHGSSGLAYIYNKLYNKTKNITFKNAADFWLDETLMYLSKKRETGMQNDAKQLGIIEGLGGVLLTLMALSDRKKDMKHNWDKMFML